MCGEIPVPVAGLLEGLQVLLHGPQLLQLLIVNGPMRLTPLLQLLTEK